MDKHLKSKDAIGLVKNWRWKIDKTGGNTGISKVIDLCVKGLRKVFGKINKTFENIYKN